MLYIVVFIITLVSMLILLHFGVNFIMSFLITYIVLMVIYCIICYIFYKLRRKALDFDCDPERYLKMLDNHEKRYHSKAKAAHYLAINRAAGHMLLGDYQTAINYLEGIDHIFLSEKNGSLLPYTINLILCYYELGEMEKAERLYETNLVQLSPFNKRLKKSVEILIGERYYYLEKYDLSYKFLKNLLDYNLSKRQYLGVLYRLAQMEVMNGETEQAIKKFEKIVKFGNKLGIVKESQKILEYMAQT